jgi:hypothetical protein
MQAQEDKTPLPLMADAVMEAMRDRGVLISTDGVRLDVTRLLGRRLLAFSLHFAAFRCMSLSLFF